MMAAAWEAVIGLEVHVQLATRTKIFCACPVRFGDPPNANTCPVCLGLPGALPVLNRAAVEKAIAAALALDCRIAPRMKFDRKNYFYPDLPKGYQISQYDEPLAADGAVEFDAGGQIRRVGLVRLHLEEDAGKLVHDAASLGGATASRVDLNRAGTPLVEIVSRPEIRSPDEASAYLQALRLALVYAGVSDCDMEKGSLRCDANVSVRRRGETALGTKVEIKNMNSFKSVRDALAHEIDRQGAAVGRGEEIIQETRLWDEARGATRAMRSKEEAHDYRYFPEPDLVPFRIDAAWIDGVRARLPEAPRARARRIVAAFGVTAADAATLVADPAVAAYFEEAAAVAGAGRGKAVANWVLSEVLREWKAAGADDLRRRIPPDSIAEIVGLIDDGTISGKIAKDVFAAASSTGDRPRAIVRMRGLVQVTDAGAIEAACRAAIDAHPDVVEKIRGGKAGAIGHLVGAVMKATRGKANPGMVNETLRRLIG
jgi:aspartyl-tRNA(Asn)/glutamyl-tRNA(Gln) amidotransferase subunit B